MTTADRKAAYQAEADIHGHFSIDVPAGAYNAQYSATGYFDDAQAPWRATEPPPFQVNPGPNASKLEGRLMRLGGIAGRVIDTRGKPVKGANIELSQSGANVMIVNTGADGTFDLRGRLLPGSYLLAVYPHRNLAPPDREAGEEGALAWATTYYPRAPTPETASRIVLRPGVEMLGLEVKLLALPAHAVRGVLLNPDGSPAPKTPIALGPMSRPALTVEWNEDEPGVGLQAESGPDGAFEFPAVVAGEWQVGAQVGQGETATHAAQWIEMADRDLEIKLKLQTPFVLDGKVTIERSKDAAPDMPFIWLVTAREQTGVLDSREYVSRTNETGALRYSHVIPGRYHVAAPSLPGYYLDSIRVGGAQVGPFVELAAGSGSLEVVYKQHPGTVRGEVKDCDSCRMMLVAEDPELRWAQPARTVECDEKGRYELASLRPGRYLAIAFRNDPDRPFWRPVFHEGLVNQASTVTLREGETATADLRAMAAPPE
jgi:hypothetical protein